MKPIGAAIGYPAWAVVQVSWWLMFGKWAHVTTCKKEFVPTRAKRNHVIPPLLFDGEVKDVAERSWTE